MYIAAAERTVVYFLRTAVLYDQHSTKRSHPGPPLSALHVNVINTF